MARRDGDLVAGITAYADGPDEMREVIRHHVNLGVDNIKLSMSGEEVSKYMAFFAGSSDVFKDYRNSFCSRLLLLGRGNCSMR